MTFSSRPILIIGAGATGLTLACELARHGAPVRIVDRLAAIVPYARATGVHSRTLEVFQDFGIAEEIVARAAIVRGTRQFAGGRMILHFRSEGLDSPFPFSLSLEQWKVEEALERLLATHGLSVERRTELIALVELSDGVHATLRRPDGTTESVETPWLIGCDGAHSTVRHLKGEHFPGEVDPRQYLVADVVLDGRQAPDEIFVYLTDHGALWWFPLPEGRSLVAGDVGKQHDDATETPVLEDVQTLIGQRAPSGLRARDPRWISWFHIHYRVTPHYRHGRTFLAGDAAHIHSPIGGQGMNTGIQDAYNLGWKLALVARGIASETLLDSYEAERRAVAQDVLAMTKGLTEKAETYLTQPPEQREQLYRYVVLPDADRLRMLRHSEELDLDYRSSTLCSDCVTEQQGTESPAAELHAGAEARDAAPLWVDDARLTLFGLLRGTQHTLLLFPGTDGREQGGAVALNALAREVAGVYGDLIRVCLVLPADADEVHDSGGAAIMVRDVEGALHRRYGAAAGRVYLIRPDGYIGFRGEPSRPSTLRRHLEMVFAGPVSRARRT